MRAVILLACLTMLCGYSVAGDLRWPVPLIEPNALRIVEERFAAGSARSLGTQEDVNQIRSIVAARKKIGSVHVSEIRWLSPTLVVAAGTDGPYQVFWPLAKKSGRWEVLMEYNRHPRSNQTLQPTAGRRDV